MEASNDRSELSTEHPRSICVGCGLCCDGTLLSHLAVSDESDLGMPLRAMGVALITAADPPVFELPCPAVDAGVCTIHHLHRPHACSLYECALSRSVLSGEVDADTARAIITSTLSTRRRIGEGGAGPEELESLLDQHFRGSI